MASKTVSPRYISQSLFAVSVILGFNLSGVTPGASATKSCIPPIPNSGNMATVNTIIPIPPIHWVKLRHIKIPLPMDSMSFKIEAPVVVKPESVSKNASVKKGIS